VFSVLCVSSSPLLLSLQDGETAIDSCCGWYYQKDKEEKKFLIIDLIQVPSSIFRIFLFFLSVGRIITDITVLQTFSPLLYWMILLMRLIPTTLMTGRELS
jgi:hypothetical protein